MVNSFPPPDPLGQQGFSGPNYRPAVTARNILHWFVPQGPIVQMYINPQSIRYSYPKGITSQRTKGGFVLQYWGEELATLAISGTTGTSGIEGINVLENLYRNEQLAFDPYAVALAAQANQNASGLGSLLGSSSTLPPGSNFVASVLGSAQGSLVASPPPPTLASLAFTVEMYWCGETYRGYFTQFQVTERADNLGMFDYELTFMVTQKRGTRQNFLAWHRSPLNGPSDSNPFHGTPYSFGPLL